MLAAAGNAELNVSGCFQDHFTQNTKANVWVFLQLENFPPDA